MKCADLKARLGEYLDQELDQSARNEVEKHLPGCYECRESLGRLAMLRKLVRETTVPEPSPTLDAHVLAAFNDYFGDLRHAAPFWRRLILSRVPVPALVFPLTALAAVLLLIAVFRLGQRVGSVEVSFPAPDPLYAVIPAPPVSEVDVPVLRERIVQVPANSRCVENETVRSAKTRIARQPSRGKTKDALPVVMPPPAADNFPPLEGFEPVASASLRVIKVKGEGRQ